MILFTLQYIIRQYNTEYNMFKLCSIIQYVSETVLTSQESMPIITFGELEENRTEHIFSVLKCR